MEGGLKITDAFYVDLTIENGLYNEKYVVQMHDYTMYCGSETRYVDFSSWGYNEDWI